MIVTRHRSVLEMKIIRWFLTTSMQKLPLLATSRRKIWAKNVEFISIMIVNSPSKLMMDIRFKRTGIINWHD